MTSTMKQADYPNGGVIPLSSTSSLKLILDDDAHAAENRNVMLAMEWPTAAAKPTFRHAVVPPESSMKPSLPDHEIILVGGELCGDVRYLADVSLKGIDELLKGKVLGYFADHPDLLPLTRNHLFGFWLDDVRFGALVDKLTAELGKWENPEEGPGASWAIAQRGVYVVYTAEGFRRASKYHYYINHLTAWSSDLVADAQCPLEFPAVVVFSDPLEREPRSQLTIVYVSKLLPLLSTPH